MSPQTHTDVEAWLGSIDPTDLRDASDLRAIAQASDAQPFSEEPVIAAVAAAREAGRTWAEIGVALGMSRQSAHSRYAERIDGAIGVLLEAALVEDDGRQVIEAVLKTRHVPTEASFSMRISRAPFGFGHSFSGSIASGESPKFRFPDSWHGTTQSLQPGRYEVGGEIRLGRTLFENVTYITVE